MHIQRGVSQRIFQSGLLALAWVNSNNISHQLQFKKDRTNLKPKGEKMNENSREIQNVALAINSRKLRGKDFGTRQRSVEKITSKQQKSRTLIIGF